MTSSSASSGKSSCKKFEHFFVDESTISENIFDGRALQIAAIIAGCPLANRVVIAVKKKAEVRVENLDNAKQNVFRTISSKNQVV